MERSAVAFSTQKALPFHPPTRPFIVPICSPFATLSALPVGTADHLTLGTADTNTLPPPSHDVDEAELFNSVTGVLAQDKRVLSLTHSQDCITSDDSSFLANGTMKQYQSTTET
ncbi:hypothetical protein BLNAU_3206 [Blattamonas nauphoetae]|uniref:Uncharacterized protein n=1 Tax=Blattamonas nauphoetae TaxID=2049346 RepID=A0ABQ9YDD7_9EUKA|nr:hypothetical protein BLNAU_3206 [Blattamonas nauphoetae]